MAVKQAILFFGVLFFGALAAAEAENCAAIDDPDARLACYDRQAARSEVPKQPEDTGAVEGHAPVTDQQPEGPKLTSEPVATTPQAADAAVAEEGADKAGLFNMDDRVDLTSTIAIVHANSQQKMVFQLANDQVWMQSTPRLLHIREGDQVTIENASVGGYLMRTQRGVTTRVERIR